MLLAATLTLSFACSDPIDDPNTEQGGNNNGGNENDNGNETATHKAGDYYKKGLAEGIVAYVDETGEHGLIISLDETRAKWSTEHHMLTVMGGEFSMEDGAINSAYIRTQDNWADLFPAFEWCHAKNALGLSSWYLPATYEMALVHQNIEAVNAGLEAQGAETIACGAGDLYWTSVEIGVQAAYCFSFNTGEISSYDTDKFNEHRVRAIRKF